MVSLKTQFKQWCDFDSTHRNRQLNIMKRHQENITQWVDVIRNNPIFPSEQMEAVLTLHRELSNILEEFSENYFDLADDAGRFANVLDLLGKEIQRVIND